MKTKLVPRAPIIYESDTKEEKDRETSFAWHLYVSDRDKEHGHVEEYHTFPSTRAQLEFLRDQITDLLYG